VQAIERPPQRSVPPLVERVRTDVILSRRIVGETQGRLDEALAILQELDAGRSSDRHDAALGGWGERIDDAIRQLSIVRAALDDLLQPNGYDG
jgi:hypothetical protein